MASIFETVLNMSMTASVVILAVLLVRVFMKKAPRKFCYLLWLVVAFRLVVPFSFESSISIFNLGGDMPAVEIPQTGTLEEIPQETPEVSEELPEEAPSSPEVIVPGGTETSRPAEDLPETDNSYPAPEVSAPTVEPPAVSHPEPEEPQLPDWVIPGITNPGNTETSRPPEDVPGNETSLPGTTLPDTEVSAPATDVPVAPPVSSPVAAPASVSVVSMVLTAVWLAGILALLGYSLVSYIKLKRRLSTAVLLEGNVYGSDRIDAPFALGFARPRIYIPFGLSDSAKEYVLAHERYHLKRLDHIVKPLSFGILAVHWFNPLCWIAFNRMSLDMELSCDEKVLQRYGDETMKKQYTKTLLDFATSKQFPSPAPLSFSEGASAKTRIKNALYWKKPKLWLSVVALVLSLVILVACAGNAITSGGEESTPAPETGIFTFEETPYQFTFVSNGDGTCAITEVYTDFYHKDNYDLVIPATSPDGDKVVEVDLNGMNTFEELIVPPYLLPETMEALADTIANSGVDGAARASKTFKAFYMDSISHCKDADHPTTVYNDLAYPDGLLPTESAQFKKREPYIQPEDVQRLATILKECTDYTEEQCYNDVLAVIEMLEKLEWESDEKLAQFKREAVSFFYRNTRRIDKVVLPAADVKVHQGFLGLSYVLADGTAVTPVYENPFTLEIVTAEEPENVLTLDEDGNEVIAFTSSRPVKDFHILTIDMADSVTAEPHPKGDSIFYHKAFTESYKLLLGENIPTRGISFIGEDGKTYQYAICYVDGKRGSYQLVSLAELAGADFEEFSLLVKRVSDSTASKKTVYLSHPMMSDYDYFSITPNQPMTNVQIYSFQAQDEHTTKGWWYEGGVASDVAVDPKASVVEFLPVAEGETIYVGAHSTTVTDTWGISFTDYQGNKRYFAVFPTLDGKRQVIEMELDQTRMQYLPNTCPELDYSMLEVVQTFTSKVFVLHDPRAEENEQYVLVHKKSDGTYVEIFRAREGFYKNVCAETNYLAFNNFEPECTTEAYVYNASTGKLIKLNQSVLPEEETISYMTWWGSHSLLFVSQLDHGTVVKGGELWCYNAQKNTYQKVFDVSDKRLQITDVEFVDQNGTSCIQVNGVYYDETYNFTEEKTYLFTTYAVNRFMEKNKQGYTLFPEAGPQVRPYREGDSTSFSNATPGASVTNKYALFYGQVDDDILLCTFKATGEDPAKGWLYEYTNTGRIDDFWLDGYEPESIEGSASYSVTDTWGFCIDGRYYAIMENTASGGEKLVDITDQVTGLALPEDLSLLFDDTASLYKDYREMNFVGWSLYHVYDWDQYFIVEKPVTLDITGDIALAFYNVESEESYYYYPGVYRFEKGKAEPTRFTIDVPALHAAYYTYHPVTDKIGYLMAIEIPENKNGTEFLGQVLKTTDGGLTWTLVREGGYITGGTSHDPVNYSTFLTEDFGVIAFLCNFDTDLAGHVYYTTDGGVSWRCMTGLDNLPRDPDEEWNLRGITLENGVYTITIRAWGYNQFLYFTSTDLENWEPVPQVLFRFATDEQIADTENYTHVYDPKAKNPTYQLLIEVTAPIKDLCFVEIDESEYRQLGETLYEIGDCTPGTPFILHTYINDIHINRGFSYTDENGNTRYLAFSESMVDGTLSLGEITFEEHEEPIYIIGATDEQIADTENYTHFYDPKVDGIYKRYNAHLLVQVFAPIESFRFEALTEDGLDYIRETLYETNLVPGQPVIIHTYINDVIPICGYSYLNEDGVRVYKELVSSMK
ncbi:MAG: DUF4652 domain-containing protein [Clostridia bacterium]|nr:DUF4652 domain-containing protein [Clostridia bacterium]